MSKPMAVTLPFVLLLMDFWPLNRWGSPSGTSSPAPVPLPPLVNFREWWWRGVYLVWEKLPFFLLSLADCGVTFVAQKNVGAVLTAAALPFSYRLENALWSYLRYVSNLVCPAGLSIIYPYRAHLPMTLVGISLALLIIWSALFLMWAKKFPYLPAGWFWFLGTLVPAIGLVQVGAQSMADRYMYIPSIGLFIVVVWGADDLIRCHPRWQTAARLAGAAALAGCLMATTIQLAYWRNSITLFSHAIEVTGDNGVAYYCLGLGCEDAGDHPAALALYQKSVAAVPDYYPAQFGLGSMLLEKGDDAGAKTHLERAETLDPHDPKLEFNMGIILLNAGKTPAGVAHLQSAVQLAADNPRYHAYLGYAWQKMTNTGQAIDEFSRALELQPDFAYARYGLASVLTSAGRTNEALAQYQTEVNLHAADPEARYNLGLALLDDRQYAEARAQFERELQLAPTEIRAHYRLAQVCQAQGRFAEAAAEYRLVLRRLPDFADARQEMAALLAAHPELK